MTGSQNPSEPLWIPDLVMFFINREFVELRARYVTSILEIPPTNV